MITIHNTEIGTVWSYSKLDSQPLSFYIDSKKHRVTGAKKEIEKQLVKEAKTST